MVYATDDTVPSKEQAVVIATRNRPVDLKRTLRSIEQAAHSDKLLIVIIDASDASQAESNRRFIASNLTLHVLYCPFSGRPAGTRQRNYGIDQLPSSVRIVHFVDDDVEVHPEYFHHLTAALRKHPDAGGVGGRILESSTVESARSSWIGRFFLLGSTSAGSVLPSGHVSYLNEANRPQSVQWLSSCASSYRREVFNAHRFDSAVEGPSPRLEDLDFSYRVHQSWPLLFEPKAQLTHYRSSVNRRSAREWWAEATARRYWFVEKNIRHPLRKPAFWWATLGQALALIASSEPEKWDALRGHLEGIRTILRRAHPLLRR